MPPLYDVIIAGAGISGLAAAHKLAQAGRKVLVLESRDRTGGRIHSVDASIPSSSSSESSSSSSSSNGIYAVEESVAVNSTTPSSLIDLGASFVHGITDNPLTELSRKVPFQLHLPSTQDGSDSLAAYAPNAHGRVKDGEEAARLEYLSHFVTFQRLHEYAQRGGPRGTAAEPREEDSVLSELLRQKSGEDEDNGVWRGIDARTREEVLKMAPLWSGWTGAQLKDVSLKYWGWEREFRGEDAVVLPGYKVLIDWHVSEIDKSGGEIRLGHRVEKVELVEDERVRIRAAVEGRGEETFEANYFVCSLPLGVMQQNPPHFDPPLPPRRIVALNRLGMGLLNKIVLTYATPWWHTSASQASDKAGSEWIVLLGDEDELPADAPVLDHLRKSRLFGQDYSRINGTSTILFFVGPPLAQGIEEVEDHVIEEVLHHRLVSCLAPARAGAEEPGKSLPAPPRKTQVTRWLSDPHSRGSYSYFPSRCASATSNGSPSTSGGGPLDMLECARPLWSERLGFCGEATEENHFASVHGPLMTGWREARRLESLLSEAQGREPGKAGET